MPVSRKTLKLYRIALREGETRISEKDGRNRILFNGQWLQKSIVVYFLNHPNEEPLGPNEQIHHKDHDRTNDDPANLERVNTKEHIEIHRDPPNRRETNVPPAGEGQGRPGKTRKSKAHRSWAGKLWMWVRRLFVNR
jgi:hypothetical protein